jgi:hypothetical protein
MQVVGPSFIAVGIARREAKISGKSMRAAITHRLHARRLLPVGPRDEPRMPMLCENRHARHRMNSWPQ